MARVKGGSKVQHRKKVLKLAKGYFGSRHRIYRTANESVMRAWAYAYRDRRNIKRDFRKLWITRINAASNQHGLSYSKFMYGLRIAEIEINRKMLSEIAIHDQQAFTTLIKMAQEALASGKKPPEKVVAPKAAKKKVDKLPEIVVSEVGNGVEIKVEAPKKAAKKTENKEKVVAKKTTAKPVAEKVDDKEKVVAKKAAAKPAAKKADDKEKVVAKKAAAKPAAKKAATKEETPKKKTATKTKKEAE